MGANRPFQVDTRGGAVLRLSEEVEILFYVLSARARKCC